MCCLLRLGLGAYLVPGVKFSVDGNKSYKLLIETCMAALSNPSVSASLILGASGSSSQSQAVSYNAVPTAIKSDRFSMHAGGDAYLVGTQVNEKKCLIDVGVNKVERAQSSTEASSKADSWNAGVGMSVIADTKGWSPSITVEGDFSRDKSSSWRLSQLDAHLTSQRGPVTIKTGKDASFARAVVTGKDIDLDIGGNFTVESRQISRTTHPRLRMALAL